MWLYWQVERTDVSLSDPQDPVVRGTRFPGHSYYQFPSSTLPVNTDFTGKRTCAGRTKQLSVCTATVSCASDHVLTCTITCQFFFFFVIFPCRLVLAAQRLSLQVTFLQNDFHSHLKGQLSFCLPASLEGWAAQPNMFCFIWEHHPVWRS